MQQRPKAPRPQFDSNVILEKLKKPQYALPAAVVVGMLAVAFGIQPNGPSSQAKDISAAVISQSSVTPVISTATVAASKSPSASPAANTTPGANGTPSVQSNQQASSGSPTTTSDVAGARATPSVAASPTVDPALQRQPTQCGAIQESTTGVSVEQSITGVSIKATKVAVYPVEYFRCILMATGGQEAYGLASSVNKAEESGMTHIVLVDLWVANASKQFGQVNVKNATLAVAGQSFVPLATLGGRSEVVVSSGQGRNLSLVIAIKDNLGATTGPMTLIVEGPLTGGNPVAGKYQLFLPTP